KWTRVFRLPLPMCRALLRVKLDDEMLLNLKVNVLTVRQLSDSCLQVLTIDIQPFGNRFGGVRFHNRFDLVGILACTGDSDYIASFEQIRRNVYLLAVDGEMAVTDQ